MCDPITIAGAALQAGSIAAKTVAQSRVDKARQQTMMAERMRQQGFDQEAAGLNARSLGRYSGFGAQEDQRAKDLGDYFAGRNGPTAVPTSNAPPTSGITAENAQREADKAHAFSDQQGHALGNVRAFGDVLGGISRQQSEDALKIGQIGGFKQGSAGVVPYEYENANGAGGSLQMLGDVMGGLGKIGVSAGLSGFGGGKVPMAPSMAGVPAASTISVAGLGGALPQQPMTLPGMNFSAIPSFARPGNLYRFF